MPAERVAGRPASLALRVTLFVGIATTLVFIAFGWIVVRSLEHHFSEQDAGELAVVAQAVHKILSDPPPDPDPDNALLRRRLEHAVAGHHGVFFHVADAAGQQIYGSPGPDWATLIAAVAPVAPVARITAQGLQAVAAGGKSFRLAVIQTRADGRGWAQGQARRYRVAVAISIDAHLHYIEAFQKTLWLATLVVCAIALLAARLAVQQGHAPIRKMSAEIRGITSAQLHVRLMPQEVPIELAGLVESFNAMLGRIEDGFRQLSNFSADLAHELRTPVTNLTTQTQVALSQERGVDAYREILYSNLEEFERMSRMIGDMLFLAQTEHDPRHLNFVAVDLAAEVQGLFDYFEAWAEDRAVSLVLKGAALPIPGDPAMLRRALGNLLSNAIRHTPRAGTVTVRVSSNGRETTVGVENPGPAIAAEHLPRLFERFYRVDPARQRQGEGAGLGLAIVKSVVDAHQGRVRVRSAHSLTCFEVIFHSMGAAPAAR